MGDPGLLHCRSGANQGRSSADHRKGAASAVFTPDACGQRPRTSQKAVQTLVKFARGPPTLVQQEQCKKFIILPGSVINDCQKNGLSWKAFRNVDLSFP